MLDQVPVFFSGRSTIKSWSLCFHTNERNVTAAFHFQHPFCSLMQLWCKELCCILLPDKKNTAWSLPVFLWALFTPTDIQLVTMQSRALAQKPFCPKRQGKPPCSTNLAAQGKNSSEFRETLEEKLCIVDLQKAPILLSDSHFMFCFHTWLYIPL